MNDKRPYWRLRLSRWIYPWWTADQVDAIKWRAHTKRAELGFSVCHDADKPCPVAAHSDQS